MPQDGLNIDGVPDPSEEVNLFVAQTNEATDPNLLANMQANFVQPASGYAMEAYAPGIQPAFENAEVETTVQINPDLLDQVDMAGMLPQAEPSFGGGILGDIMGAANNLAADVADASQSVKPQTEVVADAAPVVQNSWTGPSQGIC